MAKWLKRAVGEISKLRNHFTSYLGWKINGGIFGSGYKLDSSRVDYAMTRQLYYNTNDKYKLGAGFAKPVINTTVGFMGVPRFVSEDEGAQEVLDDFFNDNVSKTQRTLRNALREGDCFVWVTREESEDSILYPEASTRLIYNIIPPEQVTKINRDPVTGKIREYILKSNHDWEDEKGEKRKAEIIQIISRDKHIIKAEGDIPPDVDIGEHENKWGFIPIVHFNNEGDEHEEFGKSDLESIEPFLKAYHDVMLHAIKGSKMHSTPRLKLKLKDVAGFLRNNFGVTDPQKFVNDGGTINLDGHELLLFNDEEDAEFIEVNSAIGDAAVLLKFLFYCIVDTSETPEFAFGVHTPSSLSSVKEQMPILIRKVARKRELFEDSFQHLARIVLAMTSIAENMSFATFKTTLDWDDIDPRDGKEVAEELSLLTKALDTALQGEFISIDAATQFLAQYIETMNDYISDDPEIPGERERIMNTRLMRMRLEDSQFLDKQKNQIDKILEKV
nr:hypothetical protein 1 [Bacillales bacterium]